MRLLLFIGSMISVGMGVLVAAMFDRGWPRAPWTWLSAVRALVGPALVTHAATSDRPLDAVQWARWTVHHAERAGGRASGLGWQMDAALRMGIRAMVETGDVDSALAWAMAYVERPVDAWLRVLAAVSEVQGPVGLPALVVRARKSSTVEQDAGGSVALMAVAVDAHRRQGRSEAADAWRAEILDLLDLHDVHGTGWSLDDVGRIAAVFDGEPRILALLRTRVEALSGPAGRAQRAEIEDPGVWYGLSSALLANGSVETAMQAVELGTAAARARPLDPFGWLAPFEVAQHLLDRGRLVESVELGRVAIERATHSERSAAIEATHVVVGRALFALGQTAQARDVLQRAVEVMDEAAEPWSHPTRSDARPHRRVIQASGWYTLGLVHEALGSDAPTVDRMFEEARTLATRHALLKGGTAADWILDGLAARRRAGPDLGLDSRRTTVT